jgi:hypothetical protein
MFLEKLLVVQVISYCTELAGSLLRFDLFFIMKHEFSSHPHILLQATF